MATGTEFSAAVHNKAHDLVMERFAIAGVATTFLAALAEKGEARLAKSMADDPETFVPPVPPPIEE